MYRYTFRVRGGGGGAWDLLIVLPMWVVKRTSAHTEGEWCWGRVVLREGGVVEAILCAYILMPVFVARTHTVWPFRGDGGSPTSWCLKMYESLSASPTVAYFSVGQHPLTGMWWSSSWVWTCPYWKSTA